MIVIFTISHGEGRQLVLFFPYDQSSGVLDTADLGTSAINFKKLIQMPRIVPTCAAEHVVHWSAGSKMIQ